MLLGPSVASGLQLLLLFCAEPMFFRPKHRSIANSPSPAPAGRIRTNVEDARPALQLP
jgi:hypothetical protein